MTNKEIFELLKGTRKLASAPETVKFCKVRPATSVGEMHPFAKLTNKDVAEIRYLGKWKSWGFRYADADPVAGEAIKFVEGNKMYRTRPAHLARTYNTTPQTIHAILNGSSRS